MPQFRGSHSVVPESAAAASRNLLEMQIRPTPHSSDGVQQVFFNKVRRGFRCTFKFENYGFNSTARHYLSRSTPGF